MLDELNLHIPGEMQEDLIEQMWESFSGDSIPKTRFFTPNNLFWGRLNAIDGFDILIDCGTGNGDLPKEARDHGIKMGGIDIVRREGNNPVEVQIIPAHRMPFNSTLWPIVCRPDHSGWCAHLWRKATKQGSGFIYVGKPTAMPHDTECERDPDEFTESIGEEGEVMAVWYPR